MNRFQHDRQSNRPTVGPWNGPHYLESLNLRPRRGNGVQPSALVWPALGRESVGMLVLAVLLTAFALALMFMIGGLAPGLTLLSVGLVLFLVSFFAGHRPEKRVRVKRPGIAPALDSWSSLGRFVEPMVFLPTSNLFRNRLSGGAAEGGVRR